MLELLERFVTAIEKLAENSEKQTQILLSGGFPAPAPIPVTEAEAPAPQEAPKRARRTKAEIEAEKAAATSEEKNPTQKDAPVEKKPVSMEDCQNLLKQLAKIDGGNPARCFQIIVDVTGEKAKLADVDPSKLAEIYRKTQEVLNAS